MQQESNTNDSTDVQLPPKTVSSDEALSERLTGNVRDRIGPARYFERDENGQPIEDWAGVFNRVATNVAGAEPDEVDEEYWSERFEQAMRELRFMPNSPTLMNAGLPLQQLSACFVVEPKDDMDDINETQTDAASIFKSGGGVGYAFHHLRPKGARVSSTGGVSSGPLSFMELFDTTCQTVKQGGKRRGAQMAIMHAHHPDVGRFAVSKRGEDRFSNFNISIGITEDFRRAVENDETYTLYDPSTRPSENHDLRAGEAFETVAETIHFYDPEYEDAWNDDFDKPGVGIDGKPVEENFWRDYADQMPTDFSEFRDQINLEVGEPLELPAQFIWQLLIDGAHNNGEPGIFNLDEVNDEHSFDVEEHPEHYVHSTNPCCVAGDTRVHTENGMKRIDELVEEDAPDGVVTDGRLDGEPIESSSNAFVTGTDDVYQLQTEEGYSIRLTADHPVRTNDGWIEAQHLDEGEQIHVLNRDGAFGDDGSKELGEVLGWLVGDGHLKHGEERAVLNFYGDDTNVSERLADYTNEIVRDANGNGDYEINSNAVVRTVGDHASDQAEERVRSTRLYEIADGEGLVEDKLQVPESVFTGSKDMASGFLRALFAADGSVQGTHEKGYSIRLGTVSRTLAYEVQELLSNFGIYSRVYEERREAGSSELPDGNGGTNEYDTQAVHEVVISSSDMVRFRNEIGFLHDYKSARLDEALDSYVYGPQDRTFTATVESIEHDGHETVYDITEDTTHSFVANGLVVHNSEQPLEEYEACNLGHVNLSLMVDEDAQQFDEWLGRDRNQCSNIYAEARAYVDEALDNELFDETIETGTRFLDNVVTQSEFPLDDITEQVESKRKIGLGLMGFHQMLIQMGVEYGSTVSYAIAEEIMRRIDEHATKVSHDLAYQRGTFDEYEDSKWSDPTEYPEWFQTHAHEDPEEFPDGYAMRNHNVTTIAPTGTTSMIGNTTGGCEPIYQVAYFKNVGDDIQGDEMLVEFDDYFLRVLEHNDIDVEHVKEELTDLMMNNEFESIEDADSVPDDIAELFVTTQDLDAEQHIRMQAYFQHYCDSGISKTLNLSHDASVEEVGDAFMLALDLGIKGTTVYRTGSREEQVKTTRVDNKLDDDISDVDDESLVEHLVDQRNLSVKGEHTLRDELDVFPDEDEENIERECPECGSGKVNLAETCPFCSECGWSECA
jgi:ribonucleoside-diphosphate reductase alpha chain